MNQANHPHRRRNALTGQWVLVSPHRNLRPWQGATEAVGGATVPTYDPACYLCPGNIRANGIVNADYDGVFVFDNDFAALLPGSPRTETHDDPLFQQHGVRGTSRVICFSADHGKTLPELSEPAIGRVIDAWCAQSEELGAQYQWVQVFENKGAAMGCSNPHPHGQIWASDFIPNEIARETDTQDAYFRHTGRPMLFDLVERELASGERVVVATECWLAVVPYWASWPFETLLLPRFAVQRLPQLTHDQRQDLAIALRELTIRYDNLFNCSFPYSMGWHGAPFDKESHPAWQLHAHFYPPLLRSSTVRKFMVGYEMLAEPQRDLTAEQAAATLRATANVHYRQR